MNPDVQAGLKLDLEPAGRSLRVATGVTLHEILAPEGMEFPCGGRGRCKGCRVRVARGQSPPSPEDLDAFTDAEIESGWRLACRNRIQGDMAVEVAQWETPVLVDDTPLAVDPRPGLGVAVDLGTTTVVAQLIELQAGKVLSVRTALNAQACHGSDIMSRIEFAMEGDGQRRLRDIIRVQIQEMVFELLGAAGSRRAAHELREVVIVGNTVMQQLFAGLDIHPMSEHPFEPVDGGLQQWHFSELGWVAPGSATIRFLPGFGGFVGSDILAGVIACGMDRSTELTALVDLGTNGEMVVGNKDRLLCASTAAGPAFEGARISSGMRASPGAITGVSVVEGRMEFAVLGDGPVRGVCGSGLVDAVAAGLDLGIVLPSGRISGRSSLQLKDGVELTQCDIRELQLAKGAIAAGLQLLIQEWGARPEDLHRVHLSGAFGNYINLTGARRIGLLNFPVEKIVASGNTALRGAKLALCCQRSGGLEFQQLRKRVTHLSLNDHGAFQDVYVREMSFPGAR